MSSTDDFKWKPTRKGQCLLCNHGMLGGGVLNDNGLCQSCAWKRDYDEKEKTKLEQLKKRMGEELAVNKNLLNDRNVPTIAFSRYLEGRQEILEAVREIMGWKEGEE